MTDLNLDTPTREAYIKAIKEMPKGGVEKFVADCQDNHLIDNGNGKFIRKAADASEQLQLRRCIPKGWEPRFDGFAWVVRPDWQPHKPQ